MVALANSTNDCLGAWASHTTHTHLFLRHTQKSNYNLSPSCLHLFLSLTTYSPWCVNTLKIKLPLIRIFTFALWPRIS